MAGSLLQGVLRRNRGVVLCCLLLVIGLSWAYLLSGAGMSMHENDGMQMLVSSAPWTADHVVVMLVMWAVMMAAMMLPSAAPMILLYSTIVGQRRARGGSRGAPGVFASAYVAVWVAFSGLAVALQYVLDRSALLSASMHITSATIAGSVLIGAGLYQWTPLKQRCLRRCRSPLQFVMMHWRDGVGGAFMMGTRHGLYCVGCCWMLMLLLFVGGVMNILWVTGLAAFVLVEKLAPAGHWMSRAAGVVLVMVGAATLFTA